MVERQMPEKSQRKIAILIDGDNAQPVLIEKIIRETERYGTVTIRRIYGDWTTPQMNSWKPVLQKHAIQPEQQFSYTKGKNSTDSSMIIDAMDILHEEHVEGFSIVSSDSDYTRLATRIREEGLLVIGIGKETTPEAFVKACDVFVHTELMKLEEKSGDKKGSMKAKEKRELIHMLKEAYEMESKEGEAVLMSQLGIALRKIEPGFDPRKHGFKKLLPLIESFPDDFDVYPPPEDKPKVYYVSLKE